MAADRVGVEGVSKYLWGRSVMRRCNLAMRAGAALLFAVLLADRSAAESLTEALTVAYTANPDLGAERARLRATDEGVPQALAGMRPTAIATGDWGAQRQSSRSRLTSALTGTTSIANNQVYTEPHGYSLNIRQDLFDGFRTITRTAQAEANVRAGRGLLLNIEQNVFLDTVTAYVDVLSDTALVELSVGNLQVLREELSSTKARFEVGELTRTDVAQAEARVSGALSEVSQSRSSLATSRATYQRIVRRPPGTLRQPASIDRMLPPSKDAALHYAETEHPALASARFAIEASDHEVETIKGELLPTFSVEGDFTQRWESSDSTLETETASIFGRLRVPLYQAGSVSSRARQARETSTQRRLEAEGIRAQVGAGVASAWDGLVAARAQIVADRQQVRATTVALDGVRQEQRVGQRTTLDVLDAQQEQLNAQVNLVTSKRNEVVAAYTLLAATGRLSAQQLGLEVALYDPVVHYDRVRNKWFGLSVDGPR